MTEEIMLSLELDIVMFIHFNLMATYKIGEYDKNALREAPMRCEKLGIVYSDTQTNHPALIRKYNSC